MNLVAAPGLSLGTARPSAGPVGGSGAVMTRDPSQHPERRSILPWSHLERLEVVLEGVEDSFPVGSPTGEVIVDEDQLDG